MSKLEFMKELESLLLDIPLEEREEALQYYNGYFEDAGEEQEDEIMKELGTPAKVASMIKADLNANAAERENRGYFTEKGYQVSIENEDKLELTTTGNAKKSQSTEDTKKSEGQAGFDGSSNKNYNNNNSRNAYESYQANMNSNKQTNHNTRQTNSNSNTALLVILGIISFPIWFPLIMAFFGIAIGIISAILGIIVGFGAAGIAMIGAGAFLFIVGLVQISAPLYGLLCIGGGLITLGLGMLFTIACIMLCRYVLPAMIRGIVEVCRLPFKNRRVIA